MSRSRHWSKRVQGLVEEVASITGIRVSHIQALGRPTADCMSAKRIIWQTLRLWGIGFPEIGVICGNHDHSTVFSGIKAITPDEMETATGLATRLTMEGIKSNAEVERRKALHVERLKQWKEICERIK